MLTRARRRQLEEQSRNRAPPGERIPDRHALIGELEDEFDEMSSDVQRNLGLIRRRMGVTDEPLVDLEPEAPGQPEPYDEEAVRRKEFHLEELLGTFEELGLAFGEMVKRILDINFEVILRVIANIGNLVRLYIIPRQYRERIEITEGCLIMFFKAILVMIAIEILIVFPDYYFRAINIACKNTIYTFRTTALILVVYIFLNFYVVFYKRKPKVEHPDLIAEEA
ncbi:hypothetical protein TNCT_407541 [Trichonephila clavata]|uniref:Uncharacterized protein n=1 Tax=Trichonephila clavata TaxID=2740835 RepID=A0A8X6L4H2_TRICU|nr:hypothetical protein TNCT_407541 [Trichonephila clavata]